MAFILFEMRLKGGGDKIQPKNKQKDKTGSKAVLIDSTVKTRNPWWHLHTGRGLKSVLPSTLQTSKVMQSRFRTAFRKPSNKPQ